MSSAPAPGRMCAFPTGLESHTTFCLIRSSTGRRRTRSKVCSSVAGRWTRRQPATGKEMLDGLSTRKLLPDSEGRDSRTNDISIRRKVKEITRLVEHESASP